MFNRTRRALAVAMLVAIAAGFSLVASSPANAAPLAGVAEQQFFDLVNLERSVRGLSPLVRDPALDVLANDWSRQMASAGKLSHRPQLGIAVAGIEPQWRGAAENVGYGGDVNELHQRFMGSTGHRDNLLGNYNRVGVGAVVDGGRIWVTFNFLNGPAIAPTAVASTAPMGDYWVVTAQGHVRSFGSAAHHGDLAGIPLVKPIVGMTATATGNGYWLVASDGGVFAFGDARFFGSTGGMVLSKPVVGMSSTPSGNGYWLVASDGGIFAFGDAPFYGSTGSITLQQPMVGMSSTPSGNGYWMVAADGGIFAYGDAPFYGSTGGRLMPAPVNAIATTPSGNGYWIVDGLGGVYTFGAAPYAGDASGHGYGQPFTRIATTRDGHGYRLATADGRIFHFGSAGSGQSGPLGLTSPVVALANK